MAVTIWSGLTLGAIYALVATGFTLTLLPTGVFNFAQGALVIGDIHGLSVDDALRDGGDRRVAAQRSARGARRPRLRTAGGQTTARSACGG